jgi:hypothetical protein
MALIVRRHFSAWSKTILAADVGDITGALEPSVVPVYSVILRPTAVFGSWNAGDLGASERDQPTESRIMIR